MAFCVRCCRYLLLVSSFLLPVGGVVEAAWAGWWAWRSWPHRRLFAQALLWPPALLLAAAAASALTSHLLWRAANTRRLFAVVAVCAWLGLLTLVQGALCCWSLVLRNTLQPPTDAMLEALLSGTSALSWDTLQPQRVARHLTERTEPVAQDPLIYHGIMDNATAGNSISTSTLHDTNFNSESIFPYLQCCGALGPGDYRLVDPTRLPTACCVPAGPHQGHCVAVFQRGCAQPLADDLRRLAGTAAAVAGAAAAATLSILVIAAFYAAEMRKRPETTAEPAETQQTLLRNLRPRDR